MQKNFKMENYLPKFGLQILTRTFFDWIYILCFDFRKIIETQEFHFLTKIGEIRYKV